MQRESKTGSEINVFICYAEKDCEIAERLYKGLKAAGIVPWMDEFDLLTGKHREATIKDAIRKCTYFLAILSSNSLSTKGYAQKELKMALDILEEYPIDQTFILPVRVDDCKPNDERLKDRQWTDLFPDYEKGFDKILQVFKDEKSTELITEIDSDYEWDVFLSYEPDKVFDEWREDTFLFRFKGLLNQLIGPVSFFERKEISKDREVSENVKNAIIRSRCLISFCSPSYFRNYQCRYELSVMIHRWKRMAHRLGSTQDQLIIVKIFGDKMPGLVNSFEGTYDFNGLTMPGIIRSRKCDIFEKVLNQVVHRAALLIKNSPQWNNALLDVINPDTEIIKGLKPNDNFFLPRF